MGPNGSGKSTLCHVVMGNKDYSQGGKISIGGQDISSLPQMRGQIPECFNLFSILWV